MRTTFSQPDIAASVIAVPPLCRDAAGHIAHRENGRLIRHLEAGGVRTLLYGGNANLYNASLSEYEEILDALEDHSGPDTAIVPSVGPYFGTMMDQAAILAKRDFPTVMILPMVAVSTPEGVAVAVEKFVEKLGKPAVLYMKDEKYLTAALAKRLVEAGLISWIKYAVVRADPGQDPLLRDLCALVDPQIVVSGIGEQPALPHLRDFQLGGFTTGCGCVAPKLSMARLSAMKAGNWAEAERIRAVFSPLEDLRNAHGPIVVLHRAVQAAGLAETGPLQPLLAPLPENLHGPVDQAAQTLLAADQA